MTNKAPPSPTVQPGESSNSAPTDAERAKAAGEITAADTRARLIQKRMNKGELGRSRGGLDSINEGERESLLGEIARQEADLDTDPEAEKVAVAPQQPSGQKLNQQQRSSVANVGVKARLKRLQTIHLHQHRIAGEPVWIKQIGQRKLWRQRKRSWPAAPIWRACAPAPCSTSALLASAAAAEAK